MTLWLFTHKPPRRLFLWPLTHNDFWSLASEPIWPMISDLVSLTLCLVSLTLFFRPPTSYPLILFFRPLILWSSAFMIYDLVPCFSDLILLSSDLWSSYPLIFCLWIGFEERLVAIETNVQKEIGALKTIAESIRASMGPHWFDWDHINLTGTTLIWLGPH